MKLLSFFPLVALASADTDAIDFSDQRQFLDELIKSGFKVAEQPENTDGGAETFQRFLERVTPPQSESVVDNPAAEQADGGEVSAEGDRRFGRRGFGVGVGVGVNGIGGVRGRGFGPYGNVYDTAIQELRTRSIISESETVELASLNPWAGGVNGGIGIGVNEVVVGQEELLILLRRLLNILLRVLGTEVIDEEIITTPNGVLEVTDTEIIGGTPVIGRSPIIVAGGVGPYAYGGKHGKFRGLSNEEGDTVTAEQVEDDGEDEAELEQFRGGPGPVRPPPRGPTGPPRFPPPGNPGRGLPPGPGRGFPPGPGRGYPSPPFYPYPRPRPYPVPIPYPYNPYPYNPYPYYPYSNNPLVINVPGAFGLRIPGSVITGLENEVE